MISRKVILTLGFIGFFASANALALPQDGKPKQPVQVSPVKPAVKKKWTMLVFMNGHSNLDQYTTSDLNEMETVGSSADVNVVVQWASSKKARTSRVLVQKDTDSFNVTSPIVESFDRVDMGDYQELIKFLEWGIVNYPAEHYFVNVWNHGNGWMKDGESFNFSGFGEQSPNDISYDDISGNSISIPQLGQALQAASVKAGQKIDIYGSDACLMAMAEIGTELAPYVNTMVGSEEIEPLDGWPYHDFFTQWFTKPEATDHEIGQMLADTYIQSYATGYRGLTFSVTDLTQMDAFNVAFIDFATMLQEVSSNKNPSFAKAILQSAKTAETYEAHTDYVDLMGFVENLERSTINVASDTRLQALKQAFAKTVVYNKTYKKKGTGLALWIPPRAAYLKANLAEYQAMQFDRDTGWGDVLTQIHEAAGVMATDSLSDEVLAGRTDM